MGQERLIPETGVYGESTYDSGAVYAPPPVYESLVIGESRIGFAAIGSD